MQQVFYLPYLSEAKMKKGDRANSVLIRLWQLKLHVYRLKKRVSEIHHLEG